MVAYEVNSFDLCVQGFERLRSQSEFILTAYPRHGDTIESLQEDWLQDIQCCDRFDGFDHDAARKAVADFIADNAKALQHTLNDIELATWLFLCPASEALGQEYPDRLLKMGKRGGVVVSHA